MYRSEGEKKERVGGNYAGRLLWKKGKKDSGLKVIDIFLINNIL